jgi:hypothetical protein
MQGCFPARARLSGTTLLVTAPLLLVLDLKEILP